MRKAYLLGLVAVGVSIIAARGDIIPTLSSISPSGGNFTWNYSANVTVDETINPGDFFTIYDFGSIVPWMQTLEDDHVAIAGPSAVRSRDTNTWSAASG